MSPLFILILYILAILLLYWYLQHFPLVKQKSTIQWFDPPVLLKAGKPFRIEIRPVGVIFTTSERGKVQ